MSPVESYFICKPVINIPSKHVKPKVPRKPISKVTNKLSNYSIKKFFSLVSDSLDPSFTCKLVNTTSRKSVAPVIAPVIYLISL